MRMRSFLLDDMLNMPERKCKEKIRGFDGTSKSAVGGLNRKFHRRDYFDASSASLVARA